MFTFRPGMRAALTTNAGGPAPSRAPSPPDPGRPDAPRLLPVGDTGLSVQFGADIDPLVNEAVAALDLALNAAELPGLVETVPSFRSLLVVFEPAVLAWDVLEAAVRRLLASGEPPPAAPRRRWSIPTCYAPPHGEDLAEAAGLLGLAPEAVMAAHAAAEFRVYMLGFHPGLPNLGGLPPALHVSRRVTPRPPAPPGAVLIGGVQGVVLSMATPTGFYMLGRTPVRPFDRRRPEPALFRPGDAIRFRPVPPAEFAALQAAAEGGDLLAGATAEPLA